MTTAQTLAIDSLERKILSLSNKTTTNQGDLKLPAPVSQPKPVTVSKEKVPKFF